MPRRNRNSEREPINRDRLIDETVHLARELTPAAPVSDLTWADAWQANTTPAERR